MTKQELIFEIVTGGWSAEDLQDFNRVLRDCRGTLDRVQKYEYKAGDTVTFTNRSGLRGQSTVQKTGVVVRRLQKNVLVRCEEDGREWRVPPTMLSPKAQP